MIFKRLILEKMEELGLENVEEFGQRFGITRGTMYTLYSGRVSRHKTPVQPSVETLAALSVALQKPLHALFVMLGLDTYEAESVDRNEEVTVPARKPITDLENRFWLCEQVLEVKQQGGMNLERALAMLHKLTDLESHEPYLSDLPAVPAITWDHGEPLVNARVDELTGEWLDVAEDMASHQWSDDLDERPRYQTCCPICGNVLERRPREGRAAFAARETDTKSCAATLREVRRREERLEAAR